MTGWISLHRKVMDHPLYKEKRTFSKLEAWIDLLLSANHKDNKFLLGNEMVEVKAGSFITSELKLMERWGWGKSKTRSFLEMLEKDGMIVKKSDRKKTTINICNYCVYQDSENKIRPQADHKQTDSRPIADTNNNDNNDNNVNKDDDKAPAKMNPYKFYEQEGFGTLSSFIGDQLGDLVDSYGEERLLEAMKESVTNGARNLKYVKAILTNPKRGVSNAQNGRDNNKPSGERESILNGRTGWIR